MIDEIKIVIISSVVSGIVSVALAIVSLAMEKRKIVYSERNKIILDLTRKKYEGIEAIRKIVKELATYEDLGSTEPDEIIIEDFKGKKLICSAIFYSYKSLAEYTSALNECLGVYGHCVEPRVTAFLVILRNILMDYLMACKNLGISDSFLRWISCLFYDEIRNIEKKIDSVIIRSMNKTQSRYYARSGLQYRLYMWKYESYFKKTNMYKMINDNNSILFEIINHREEIDRVVEETKGDIEEALKKYCEENLLCNLK